MFPVIWILPPTGSPRYEIAVSPARRRTTSCCEWIKEDLTPFQRRSIGIAMSEILEVNGINVCDTEYGKNLGQGLFDFRLRHGADDIVAMFTTKTPDERDKEPILLRVYCHAYGDKIVLLLAGYDKQADASRKRENQEIKLARKRLTEFKQQRQRLKRQRRSRTARKTGR